MQKIDLSRDVDRETPITQPWLEDILGAPSSVCDGHVLWIGPDCCRASTRPHILRLANGNYEMYVARTTDECIGIPGETCLDVLAFCHLTEWPICQPGESPCSPVSGEPNRRIDS